MKFSIKDCTFDVDVNAFKSDADLIDFIKAQGYRLKDRLIKDTVKSLNIKYKNESIATVGKFEKSKEPNKKDSNGGSES